MNIKFKLGFNLEKLNSILNPILNPNTSDIIKPILSGKLIPKNKNGNKITIKKENKGTFTKYCEGEVTEDCINKGKNSPNPKTRKRAIFAENARKWKN